MTNEKIYTAHLEVQSFERMHFKLKKPIEQYLFYLTGTSQNSEDMAQEVFIKLWINWTRLESMKEDDLKDYVFMIIRNQIINERKQNSRPKRNKRRFYIEYSKTHSEFYVHDEVLVAEGFRVYQQAVNELTQKERMVYLYHQKDYTADEIAKILNRSKYTVHNQLSAAYKTVKTYLNKNYGWNLSE